MTGPRQSKCDAQALAARAATPANTEATGTPTKSAPMASDPKEPTCV